MIQTQPTIENKVMAVPDINFEESVIRRRKSFQAPDWDVAFHPATNQNFRLEGTPALLFFWDGKKVHRITDERLKEEIARIIDYSL